MGLAPFVWMTTARAAPATSAMRTAVCWPYSPTSAAPPSHKPELRRAELADLRSHPLSLLD
jgi:hypothetical protein